LALAVLVIAGLFIAFRRSQCMAKLKHTRLLTYTVHDHRRIDNTYTLYNIIIMVYLM